MDSTYIVNPTCSKVVRRKKKHFPSPARLNIYIFEIIRLLRYCLLMEHNILIINMHKESCNYSLIYLYYLLLWCAWELHPHLHSANSIGACNISVAQQNGLGCSQRINVNFRSRLLLLHIVERILSSPFCTRCHRNSIHRY